MSEACWGNKFEIQINEKFWIFSRLLRLYLLLSYTFNFTFIKFLEIVNYKFQNKCKINLN
jgi:hypothetical protein